MAKKDTRSPLHHPPDERPIPPPRAPAHTPGASVEQTASDVVDSAPAKREEEDRVAAERQAEGGSLATGIGDDSP